MTNIKTIVESLTATLKLLIIVVVTFTAGMYLNSMHDKSTMTEYIQQVKEHKKQAKAAIDSAEAAKKRVAAWETKAGELQKKADSLAVREKIASQKVEHAKVEVAQLKSSLAGMLTLQDSANTMAQIIPKQDRIIVTQDSIIKDLRGQNTLHSKTIAFKDSSLRVLKISNDSLIVLLKKVPDAPKDPGKWVWGIPKPSRTTSFFAGMGAGILTAVLILK